MIRIGIKNKIQCLVPPSAECKVVGNKWVFIIKQNNDSNIAKYKARLVAKWFQQTEGIDYFKTFSPIVRAFTVRVILSLAVMQRWMIR